MANDGFSVNNLQLPEDYVPPPKTVKAKLHKPQREFVIITNKQLAVLREGCARGTVWNVFAELVWRDWKGGGKPFKFSHESMRKLSISHDSGTKAVRTLVELGLISASQPSKQRSFVVTVHKL